MNYDTMTIESLAEDCFNKSGYKINKQDLISRITHLCENHKKQVSKLPIHGVSCIALDDLKKQLEIEKEDKERNKDNMFISTFQDGKIDATKKAIDILGGNCT